MLTRRGWVAGILAGALLVIGRVFGTVEGYIAGATIAVLLVGSVLWLVATRLDVSVTRVLHPPKVHAGSSTRVDLAVVNKGRRRSPVLSLRDRVSGTRGASLLVAPLAGPDPLEPLDESFFHTAPYVYRLPVELDVPPERVWESLTSDRALADWGLGLHKLEWTSPRPLGVGSTREVTLPGRAMTVRERFFRWDEGHRKTFYVTEADRPLLRRFGEDYMVEATPGGSRFTWTIAMEPLPAPVSTPEPCRCFLPILVSPSAC